MLLDTRRETRNVPVLAGRYNHPGAGEIGAVMAL